MEIILLVIFVLGYTAIAFEHSINVNKAASALITGVLLWTVYILNVPDKEHITLELTEHLGELSGVLFFLLGAMTIVELIDAHEGFDIITSRINQTDKRKLLWTVSVITFFLSAILDNLTTTIVLVSLLRKLIKDDKDRMFFVGMVVIAANAGGAWSPIGDVTTTMLWIGGQITAFEITKGLILPSLVCLITPLLLLSFKLKGNIERPVTSKTNGTNGSEPCCPYKKLVFFSGVGILVAVPVFKTVTHLPPYMGILIGLGILWVITELIHKNKEDAEKHALSVSHALRKADTTSILFFLGILISIAAFQSTGMLTQVANWLTEKIASDTIIVLAIGLLSSIIDNVPLVAAAIGMYDISVVPTDSFFWEFLAYAAGTGGSALIIGSAAGVAAMGMEKINFFWYLKNISLLALAGYFAGAGFYLLQTYLLNW